MDEVKKIKTMEVSTRGHDLKLYKKFVTNGTGCHGGLSMGRV